MSNAATTVCPQCESVLTKGNLRRHLKLSCSKSKLNGHVSPYVPQPTSYIPTSAYRSRSSSCESTVPRSVAGDTDGGYDEEIAASVIDAAAVAILDQHSIYTEGELVHYLAEFYGDIPLGLYT